MAFAAATVLMLEQRLLARRASLGPALERFVNAARVGDFDLELLDVASLVAGIAADVEQLARLQSSRDCTATA